MQPVCSEQVEEEDVFETNDDGLNDDNTCLILKVFEVWHYDNIEQYHPTRNPDIGLFTQYVNNFMIMKLGQSSLYIIACCSQKINLLIEFQNSQKKLEMRQMARTPPWEAWA
uniref:Uncharacterized protein n=1 Tax=Romanomermis culicivorax TaxID=13658 RepID=A0A915JZD2_ROMCU